MRVDGRADSVRIGAITSMKIHPADAELRICGGLPPYFPEASQTIPMLTEALKLP
jgi:hypothetical protein